VTQLCGHCGRLMVERLQLCKVPRMFCSDPCRQAYHNQLRKDKRTEKRRKVCEMCSEAFTASRRDAKTCSVGCKQIAYRQRKKEVELNR
jgi:hypothetical protein